MRSTSLLFLISVTASVMALSVGHSLAGRIGLLLGLVLAISLSVFMIFYRERSVEKELGAKPLLGHDPWGVNQAVAQMSGKGRMRPPTVLSFDSQTATILVLGGKFIDPRILVSDQFLHKFDNSERQLLLTLALGHVRHFERTRTALLMLTQHLFYWSARVLDRFIPINWLSKELSLPLFSSLVIPVLKSLDYLAISANDFLTADKWAAQLTENEAGVADVLSALASHHQLHPIKVDRLWHNRFLVNPAVTHSPILSNQPRIEFRLEQLVGEQFT